MSVRLLLLDQDPEPSDGAAELTYVRLSATDAGSSGVDPNNVDVRVLRAVPISGAASSPAGDAVLLSFASPHGLGPSTITTVSVSAATLSASPSTIATSAPHGLVSGQEVLISGVKGNTSLNGSWFCTVVDTTHFTVPVAGVAPYAGGGTVVGPVGQSAQVLVAGVVGFGAALNAAWTVTVVDAQTLSVPFAPPAGATYVTGGSVTVTPMLLAGASHSTPVVITTEYPHGLGPVNTVVQALVSDAGVWTGANGDWVGVVTDSSTVSLTGSTPVSLPPPHSGATGEVVFCAGSGAALAYHAGSIQSGWGGTAALLVDGKTLALNLTPTVPMVSAAPHFVRAIVNDVGADIQPLVTLYGFTTLDDLAPAVMSAVALDPQTVQLAFYVPVLQESATGSGALNPANYTIVPTAGLPAVAPPVTSVAQVAPAGQPGYAPNTVLLSLAYPMTRGATYLVTVTAVQDLVGNVAAPPTNTASFTGWQSVVPGRAFSAYSWWPVANQLEDTSGDLRNLIACFQEVADTILGEIDTFLDILDPDLAPAAWLPSMLADQGNPFAFLLGQLSTNDQRRLAHALVFVYQLKGTDTGIVQALNFFLGIEATVSYESPGDQPLGLGCLTGPVSTTVAAGSAGVPFPALVSPPTPFNLDVVSTSGFAAPTGQLQVDGQVVTYTAAQPSIAYAPPVLKVAAGSVGTNVSTFAGSGVLSVASVPSGYPGAGTVYLPRLGALISFTGTTSATLTGCATLNGASGALDLNDVVDAVSGPDVSTLTGAGVLLTSTLPPSYPTSGSAYLKRLGATVTFAGTTSASLTGCAVVGVATGAILAGDEIAGTVFANCTGGVATPALDDVVQPVGLSIRLGAAPYTAELMTFFVDVSADLTAQQVANAEAIVGYMRRAGTRPVLRTPEQAAPAVPMLTLGEFTIGPGGSWQLV